MQLGPHHYSEFLCLLCALFLYKRLRNSFMIAFIPFLAIVLSAELASNYLFYTHGVRTIWLFNILAAVITLFYAYIFLRFSNSQKHRMFLKWICVGFVIAWGCYYLIWRDINTFNNYFFSLNSLLQLLFSCLFFYQYLNSEDTDFHIRYKAGLWIAAGVLIFNCGSALVFVLYDYIRANELKIGKWPLYNFIPRYLSILLYSCITVSFFTWKKPKLILSPPSSSQASSS